MEIMNRDDGHRGKFFTEKDGKILAEMTYVWAGKKFIIDHTEVSEELAGMGIGKKLVHKAVEMAREKSVKILPLCPFAKKVFDKTEEYQDVMFS
jgi:predicted GNAT family acetyltransferase